MTCAELAEQMRLEGIPLNLVDWRSTRPSECFVIEERGPAWVTFYAERGLETGLQTFPTEDAACQHILGEVRAYARTAGIIHKPL